MRLSETTILQIVSGFKPSTDGIGDFARLLGETLVRDYSIRTHFLVHRKPERLIDPAEIAPNTLSYSEGTSQEQFRSALQEVFQQGTFHSVLLHYASYSYSRTGNPYSFCLGMEELAHRLPLDVFFHEVYADGPPWKRAFWTRGEQMRSVELLQRIRRAGFTSNRRFAAQLEQFPSAGSEIVRIPIFSNMGEPADITPLAARKRQMVIFGQRPTRLRLYKKRQILEKICRSIGAESIIDVGSGTGGEIPESIAGRPVECAGWMSELQISQLLSESLAGVIGYWPDVWAKSGVIASYAAHGVLPIMVPLEPRPVPKDEPRPYVEVAELESLQQLDGRISDGVLQQIVDRTYGFYMAHQSVARSAETIASALHM